jgi:hypothetical protein
MTLILQEARQFFHGALNTLAKNASANTFVPCRTQKGKRFDLSQICVAAASV